MKLLGSLFALSDKFTMAASLIAIIVAVLIAFKTMAGNIAERAREIGVLKAVGWTNRNVVTQLLAESIIQCLLAGLLGLLVALVAAFGLSFIKVNIPIPWEMSPTPHFLPGGGDQIFKTLRLPVHVPWTLAAFCRPPFCSDRRRHRWRSSAEVFQKSNLRRFYDMNNGTILTGNDLSKKYGDLEVVKNVSLSIAAGEFVCLVGKSGCGKTTLLSILSGLERPTAGKVMLDGKDITSATEDELALFRRNNVGFIFQSFNLIPTLSAWENVALPLFPIKMPAEERERRAMELLERMDMLPRVDHLPSALSGGEKQRVAIARALINHPKVLFADEPTGNLDSATGDAIMDILDRLHTQEGVAILMVTHEAELAKTADRVIRMRDGEVVS